jgi:predicted RecB family nuclease
MTTKITRDIIESYLNCKYKGHLKLNGASGTPSDYEVMTTAASASSREQALVGLVARFGEEDTCRGTSVTAATLKRGASLLVDARLEDDSMSLGVDALKRADGPSKLGGHYYVPILYNHGDKAGRRQKLLLAALGLMLGRVQGLRPITGLVARGPEARLGKVRLDAKLYKKAEQVLNEVKQLQAEGEPPRLVLNGHCQMCEFRRQCREQAVKEDSLSLLRGLGEKAIRGYERKGILTLAQLAQTFRPRRRNKRAARQTKRHHALQAMAIRDKRAYVFGTPELPNSRVTIYLDMEGLPDEGLVYLIGMTVDHGGTEVQHSFWADNKGQEQQMFEQFLAEMGRYENFVVVSYGEYERSFLKRMKKTVGGADQVDRILGAWVNLLSVVYTHLYFPCHSNGLKDVAACLGCSWSEADASGLQSIAWRKWWEAGLAEWKARLVRYNLEDCAALKKVTAFVRYVGRLDEQKGLEAPGGEGCLPVGRAEWQGSQSGRPKWHDITAAIPDFDLIRRCGYFDYQREKVYFRTNETIRKVRARRAKGRARKLPPNRTVEIRQEACPSCNSSNILRLSGSAKIKVGYDLRFSRSGIRRQVIHYTAAIHRCRECRKEFRPERYKRRDKHLHGLKSWAMYQHVAQRISLHNLQDMFEEFFGLRIVEEELLMIKSLMAKRYMCTWEKIRDKILSGHVIHVDETPINLRSGKGYVWVLANMEEVIYLYQPTREGAFLHELLRPFSGVLISDFFGAYESLECKQQRCLIHLARDFNADILKNPYDEELKSLGSDFGGLLRKIISTVDRYGLRKKHLGKHGGDVRRFFRILAARQYRSELAEAYQARLIKNESRLFTFLEYDGVPWNNNNAECAVKRFACYRRISDGQILEAGLKDYLVLLSIFQTCKYKGVSFLKFLLSGEEDIGTFCERRGEGNDHPAIEVYPTGFPRTRRRAGRGDRLNDDQG